MRLIRLKKIVIEIIDRPEIIDKADFYLYPYGKEFKCDFDDIVKSEKEVYELIKKQFDLQNLIRKMVEEYKSNEIMLSILNETITDQWNKSIPYY